MRLMREHSLLAPHRVGHPQGPKAHERGITTDRINEMWGTDMTATWTEGERQAAVFVAVDHCSAQCVGIHGPKHGTRFEALEPIRPGVRELYGAFSSNVSDSLVLRHDHGSQYVSQLLYEEMRFIGMNPNVANVEDAADPRHRG